MRRALAALAALCLAAPVDAKVLITYDHTSSSTVPQTPHEQVRAVVDVLRHHGRVAGRDFVVAHPRAVRTEFARIGVVTWNFGNAGAYTESFDAVIHCAFNGRYNTTITTYRPDSLTLSATVAGTGASHGRGLPTVPQLFLFGHSSIANFNDGTACTSGVSTIHGAGEGSGNHEAEGTIYPMGGDEGWFAINSTERGLRNATSPAGGLRPILGVGVNAVMTHAEYNGHMPVNADSVGRQAFPDTLMVWERPNVHVTGAASNVFVMSVGIQNASDSTGLATYKQAMDHTVLYAGLARLDSLSGGRVFGGGSRSVAVLVEGGGTRSDRRHPGGIFAADTTVLRATADSVRALGIPLTVAADPESLAVNAGDIAIWKAFGNVRFAPWVRVGMDTTAALLGNASVERVVDPFGRYRNRAAVGPGTADSSVYALVLASRNALRSLVGGTFLSGAIVPFEYDWSPKQMRLRNPVPGVDSILYALRLAGVTTLVQDMQSLDTSPTYAAVNPKGFGRLAEGVYPVRLGGVAGDRITLIGFARRSLVGSSRFIGIAPDTSAPYCDPGPCPEYSVAHTLGTGFWHGMHSEFNNADALDTDDYIDSANLGVTLSYLDKVVGVRGPASVLVLSAQGLAGDNVTNPTRHNWYVLKHLAHTFRVVNRLANRTVLRIAHLDEVQP